MTVLHPRAQRDYFFNMGWIKKSGWEKAQVPFEKPKR
jgi:hypothetical protein